MKSWQSLSALKTVKQEVETLAVTLANALESVIATPSDELKELEAISAPLQDFARVPGILQLMELSSLALLATEILRLLEDTQVGETGMDNRELDLRLESAFLASTDLPALLEYFLRSGSDEFSHVSQQVNRLRKARGCAIVFSPGTLLEKDNVNFREKFAGNTGRMHELLAKQAGYFTRCCKALEKNPGDEKAIQALANVTGNLELMLRDHKIGVLWGLARALVEVREQDGLDREQFTGCLRALIPFATALAAPGTGTLQATIDETVLESILDLIARSAIQQGRSGIIRLWYNLDMTTGREFRSEYRKLQISYYNKKALRTSLQLVNDDITVLIESINGLAEAPELDRSRVRDVFGLIKGIRDVLGVLRLQYLVELVDQTLARVPGDNMAEALAMAAGLLFRVNKELCSKLDNMERELFSSDTAITTVETFNTGRLQVLQNANATMGVVIAALDQYMDGKAQAPAETPESAHLLQAIASLDDLACVLDTLPMPAQAGILAVARDYLGWYRQQGVASPEDVDFTVLSHLLIHMSAGLSQLAMGRETVDSGNFGMAADNAAILRKLLDRHAQQNRPATREKLVVISSVPHAPETVEANSAVSEESTEAKIPEAPTLPAEAAEDNLAAIFAEESGEVIQQLNQCRQLLAEQGFSGELAAECKRHFHTLKGSGRMVEAFAISQLSGSMETLWEQIVDKPAKFGEVQLALTGKAVQLLESLKAGFCAIGDGHHGGTQVLALCEEIASTRHVSAPEQPAEARTVSPFKPVIVPMALPAPAAEADGIEIHEPRQTVIAQDLPADSWLDPAADAAGPASEPAAEAQATVREEPVDEGLLAVFLDELEELMQSLDTVRSKWLATPGDKSCLDEYLRCLHTIKGSAALVNEHELSTQAHEFETYVLAAGTSTAAFDAGFFAACDARLHGLHEIYSLYGRDEDGHITRGKPADTATGEYSGEHQASVEAGMPDTAADIPTPSSCEPPAEATAAESVTTPVAAVRQKPVAMPRPAMMNAGSRQPAPDEQVRVSGKLLRSLLNDADEINFSRSRVESGFQEIGTLLVDMDETLHRLLSCVRHFEDRARGRQVETEDLKSGNPPARVRNESRLARQDGFDALEMDSYTELQELTLSMAEDYNDLQDIRLNLASRVKDIDNILNGQQRLTNSLQDGLISSQMVPFSSVVPRLERLARQISSKLGKNVAFTVHNEQGSIDRNMLQAIISPLEHIIRNAIDHGIESPEARQAAGKPEQATLQISVSRKGASIWLDIRDDGQGIDVGKVREKARSSGLLGEEEEISDEESVRLLFMPGFSTSATVTGISGRGVGLDVVRSEIEYIGGTVEVSTSRGEGTVFHISLPLTSSLNRALLFEIQQTRYVVLMNSLDGVLTEKLASIHQRQKQQDSPGFAYAGRRYEYLYLGKLINEGFSPRPDSIDSSIPLLLVSSEGRNYALHIDSIIESRDIVVKSFGQQFAAMPGIAGGVIMPDGNVAIVLDLKSLVGLYGKENRPAMEAPRTLTGRGDTEQQRKLVLVVDDSITVRKVTSSILKRHGMDVVTARNGLEALEQLQKLPPDLILLDIEMPKMDGFEVAAWVRAQNEPVCSIPIIMITSRIGEKHRSRAEQIGVNEYLCKPFHEDNLLAHIRSY